MTEEQKLLEKTLPFDQYSRQKIVAYLIDQGIRKNSNNKKLNIIDLGGHKGETARFQLEDHVTILDVFDEKYENYVKGDATKTNFKDNTFDIACSFDVFEHIPRNLRQAFIDEALRISKFGLFVAMPIDTSGKVSSAEKLLNDFHKTMFSSDHRWLKEHIDYKIPTESEIIELIKKSGAASTAVYSNQIGDWQLMQMLIFASAKNPEITNYVNEINYWYNKHTIELDGNIDIGYRGVFFISKDKIVVDGVANAIKGMQIEAKKNGKYTTVSQDTFRHFSKSFAKISKQYTELHEKYYRSQKTKSGLLQENEALKESLTTAQADIHTLQSQLTGVYVSTSWKLTKPIRIAKRIISGKD